MNERVNPFDHVNLATMIISTLCKEDHQVNSRYLNVQSDAAGEYHIGEYESVNLV